jgi:hypothetical protein
MRRVIMNKKQIIKISIGLLIALIGFLLRVYYPDQSGLLLWIPYLLIGLGGGIFGHFVGDLIKMKLSEKKPSYVKKIEIEQKDERNILVMRLAKEKAYDAMLYIFAGLILIFALMQIQTQVTVMLIVAYVISIITFVIFFNKYNKEI